MKKLLWFSGIFVLGLFLAVLIYGLYNMRDRHKGYHLDINIKATEPVRLHAGFAALTITPRVIDTWTDTQGDARYNPDEGDTFDDRTGSGQFDAVWMAGFQNKKPANGIHDDLWARAMVIDDGNTRIAWVALDAIGFFGCDVIDVRKHIPESMGITYAIISSSHTHSGPDLMGLWGPRLLKSGVDPDYKDFVKTQIINAIELAVKNLRPAIFKFATDKDGSTRMIADTRKPIVINPEIRIMQAIDSETGETLGTLVQWDNHPETVWSKNLLITSDFPHFLREGIEKGIYNGDSLVTPGFGGIAMFVTGNIGGLMTTSPGVGIECPFTDTVYYEPSFDKVRAQGLGLAGLTIDALNSPHVTTVDYGNINLKAKTVILPLDNINFKLGAILGLFDRGLTGWMKFRSEISFWQLGPGSFLHHPGELYPEIADGGIESPYGQDFIIEPQEIPPLRELMPGEYLFITGLSNDMIGYIIPKSQWDVSSPHTYGYESAPYGEVNSLGPETGPMIHAAIRELITGLE
ncbi:MAG: neutral/alkaline non-lysosomal ceramidase N-terminal domain-containing protein [Bacteroidales bacterium]